LSGDFFAAVPPPGGRKSSFLFVFRDGHTVDGDGFGGALSLIHAGPGGQGFYNGLTVTRVEKDFVVEAGQGADGRGTTI